jgi:hypothetical protein
VKPSILAMLNDAEQDLVRQTDKAALAGLDEDALLHLHARARRARNKYVKLYRRRASAQVAEDSSRAGAHPRHARAALKAEVFEDALARVSRYLARAARASANQLRTDRIAATRPPGKGRLPGPRRVSGSPRPPDTKATAPSTRDTPAAKRARASSRAAARRAERKREAR